MPLVEAIMANFFRSRVGAFNRPQITPEMVEMQSGNFWGDLLQAAGAAAPGVLQQVQESKRQQAIDELNRRFAESEEQRRQEAHEFDIAEASRNLNLIRADSRIGRAITQPVTDISIRAPAGIPVTRPEVTTQRQQTLGEAVQSGQTVPVEDPVTGQIVEVPAELYRPVTVRGEQFYSSPVATTDPVEAARQMALLEEQRRTREILARQYGEAGRASGQLPAQTALGETLIGTEGKIPEGYASVLRPPPKETDENGNALSPTALFNSRRLWLDSIRDDVNRRLKAIEDEGVVVKADGTRISGVTYQPIPTRQELYAQIESEYGYRPGAFMAAESSIARGTEWPAEMFGGADAGTGTEPAGGSAGPGGGGTPPLGETGGLSEEEVASIIDHVTGQGFSQIETADQMRAAGYNDNEISQVLRTLQGRQ